MKSNGAFGSLDLPLILSVQVVYLLAAFFNVIVLRELLGVVLLTFVSGYLILRLMKLDRRLGLVNTVVLSVGLSVSFDMFIGLVANFLLPFVGIGRPLDEFPLLVVFNVSLVLILLGSQLRGRAPPTVGFDLKKLLSPRVILFAVFLPALGVVGSIYAAATNDGVLLLALDVAIVLVIFVGVLFRSKVSMFFALVVIVIALALLFRAPLISRYSLGSDQFDEYYVFRHLNANGYWSQDFNWNVPGLAGLELGKANNMLSVTILPQVYSQVLGISSLSTFDFLYFLIGSFVLLALYSLYCTQVDRTEALLGVFFFVSAMLEVFGLGPDKQIVATLFYVLIFFLFFNKELVSFEKTVLLVIFGASIIVSHYSLSYILIFLVFFLWFISFVFKKPSRISLGICVLFLVMAFAWYIFVSGSANFTDFVRFGNNIYSNFLTDFFSPGARSSQVLTGIGATSAVSFLHQIGRYVFYLGDALIVLGVFWLIVKRKKLKFDAEFAALIVLNLFILIMTIAVPMLASSFTESRFYLVCCLFLSPAAILGIRAVSEIGQKLWRRSTFIGLALIFLIIFFMFNSEFVYAITGDVTYEVQMSMYNQSRLYMSSQLYVWPGEVVGGQWLSNHMDSGEKSIVFSDATAQENVLAAFCDLDIPGVQVLSNTTVSLPSGSFIYLSWINIDPGIMYAAFSQYKTSGISGLLNSTDLVYSNGYCEVYQAP